MMILKEYTRLKEEILNCDIIKNSENKRLDEITCILDKEINSNRAKRKIQNFQELFNLLEKRDALSPDNVKPLKMITNNIGLKYLEDLIKSYESKLKHFGFDDKTYAEELFNASSSTVSQASTSNLSSHPTSQMNSSLQKKKSLIYDTIASEIGTYWRSLARNLDVKEGEIDNIESQFQQDLKGKVYRVFEIFEYKSDPNYWMHNIIKGLDKAGRKDLSNRVSMIMSMNI